MKKIYPRLEVLPLSKLHPMPQNPRTVSAEALGRLTKSLHEFGNLQPICFNVRTGRIVSGHQRLKCLEALQRKETEVWCVDLDAKKEKAALLALNKLAGEWDLPGLKDMLLELDAMNTDLDLTQFAKEEIEELMTAAPPPEDKESKDKEPMTCPKCGHIFSP